MKMEYFKKIVKESVIILIISSLLGLISGTVLSLNEEILYSIPIILLTLPALNSLIGDISIVLVSRLSTHLYIGTIAPEVKKSDRLKEDFIGLLLTITFSFGALITIGYIFLSISGKEIVSPFIIITILLITVLLLFIFLFIILFIFSILLFKKGKDPNNILIPIITSIIDLLTPLLIIILIIIFI
jgi:mgtE-like transporter